MRPAYVSTCHFATQDSLLRTTTRTSSTCTGAYTSEMSLAVIQKTINESKALSFNVCFRPVSAHETWSVNWSFFKMPNWHFPYRKSGTLCSISYSTLHMSLDYIVNWLQIIHLLLVWIYIKKNTVFELGIPLDSSSLYLIGQKKINYMRLAWLWFG